MARRQFTYWNRKFHVYLGLYFLLFLWLFAVTGLLLNNTSWKVFKGKPVDIESVVPITVPTATDDIAKAHEIMAQLGVTGEMHRVNPRNKDSYDFGFSVVRPHAFTFVRVDYEESVAAVRVREWGFWSGFARLHTFASMSARGNGMFRDWWMTKVWSVAVDAVAIGVIVMLCGGLWMWWQLKPKRRVGLACLGAGCLSCGLFVVGLRALFT